MYFTAKDVLREVEKIASENGDFVYRDQGGEGRCGYAGKEQGSLEGTPCIVGSALIALGVDRNQLKDESWGADAVVPKYVVDMHMDKVSLHRLAMIQWDQDNGHSWGEAVNGNEAR